MNFVPVFVLCAAFVSCAEGLGKRKEHHLNITIFITDNEYDQYTVTAFKRGLNRLKEGTKYYVRETTVQLNKDNAYEAGEKLCQTLAGGVAAIFGPECPDMNEIVISTTASLRIPHFQTAWDSKLSHLGGDSGTVFNLHPGTTDLSKALATLIRENDWHSYTVIYEDDEGLVRLRESLKQKRSDEDVITFKKLGPGPDYRAVLKDIKESENGRFILDCKADRILAVLRDAQQVKLLQDYHSYILTDLDAHTLDWSEFRGIAANITAIRLIDPASDVTEGIKKFWRIDTDNMKTNTALLYDALNIFLTSIRDASAKETLAIAPLICEDSELSSHGERVAELVRKPPKNSRRPLPGPLTGPIFFDRLGQRTNFNLQIIELAKKELKFRVTGTWNSKKPHAISYAVTSEEREKELQKEIQQKNFRVVSKIGAPYLMARHVPQGKTLYGNDRWEGYALDLMQAICSTLNCSYTFEEVPDGKYGSYDPYKKEWDGLIGHLLKRKADLAVCDLTITYERRKAVDFTMPFMTLGISILYAKAVKVPPELLSFSHPLSLDVWLYTATAYLVISMIIFLAARLNPNDWENPHPCNPNPEELENIWTIRNCCWLTLGSIMTQGCDILPKGGSTRMATASWWFFSLIMTSSYTANMAAFLTMSRMGSTIENAEGLAAQNKIKYGCLSGGSTCAFFKDTNFSTYHQMWVQMESADPTVFETSNEDGVKRVLTSKRNYAFLMESSSIEYVTESNCELMQVGGQIDSKSYGIALTSNFQYRKSFNEAILKLQEAGTLNNLKRKWWTEKNGGGICKEREGSEGKSKDELGLDNVGGVFVVLTVGIIVAFSFSLCEFTWMVKKIAVKEHIGFKEAMKRELRFVLNIWARKKLIKKTD